ncbi:MAG: ABC transporter permease [Lachnospiraceae bacterium]|nr:ABC transporter permease [Lachnospiraceae bacterium]
MFANIFAKQLKLGFRNKSNMFWTLMFPIMLGILFKVAFGGIFSTYELSAIKTAVVYETENEQLRENIRDFLEGLSSDGEKKLLDITYTDADTAMEMLKDESQVNGIITVKDDGRLALSVWDNGVRSTIQGNIVMTYNQNVELVERTVREDPGKAADVIDRISRRISYIDAKGLEGENKDPYVAYFYNLIAMTALFAALCSVRIGNSCQANMSALGARTNASPVRRMAIQAASLLAAYIVQTTVILIGITFLLFGLGVNFGGDIPMIYVTTVLASLLGTALGFFVGNIGSWSVDKKEGILTAIIMLGCALSGLMLGELKVIVEENAPLINRINPAAVISDAYYCLNMFGVGARYMQKVIYMIAGSAVLTVAGLFLGRRNHYDSI